jgi:hypothetical protein
VCSGSTVILFSSSVCQRGSDETSAHFMDCATNYLCLFQYSSLLSDGGASEDEGFNSLNSPFATLQKHSSLSKDDPDDERPFHRMHRLR